MQKQRKNKLKPQPPGQLLQRCLPKGALLQPSKLLVLFHMETLYKNERTKNDKSQNIYIKKQQNLKDL